MSFWSKMFGSDKVVDGLMSAADNMWETTEEKSKAKMMFLKLYEPFKLAQRFALFIFGIPFVAVHVTLMFAWLGSLYFMGDSDQLKFTVDQLHLIAQANNHTLGEPVLWIVGFYFLGGAGEGMIKAAAARWSKK